MVFYLWYSTRIWTMFFLSLRHSTRVYASSSSQSWPVIDDDVFCGRIHFFPPPIHWHSASFYTTARQEVAVTYLRRWDLKDMDIWCIQAHKDSGANICPIVKLSRSKYAVHEDWKWSVFAQESWCRCTVRSHICLHEWLSVEQLVSELK